MYEPLIKALFQIYSLVYTLWREVTVMLWVSLFLGFKFIQIFCITLAAF